MGADDDGAGGWHGAYPSQERSRRSSQGRARLQSLIGVARPAG